MSLLVLHITIAIYFLFTPCLSFNMLGPANIIYQSFDYCETKATDIEIWITQRKHNRTTNVLDITLTTPWPFDDNLILEIASEVKKEGGYKPGSFQMKDTICKVLSTLLGGVFEAFLELAGRDDCPIPDGTYEILGFYLDNDKMTVPLLYGEYRTLLQLWKDKELKGCYYIYLNIVPKD